MAKKPTPPPLPSAPLPKPAPLTTAERLQRIEAMGQRIEGYVQFICRVGDLTGTSAEAKEAAITAFHDRLERLESQLARIQEELKLG
jgi:hypothetical protein